MNSNLAYCGLSCETCPIHLATMEPDFAIQQKMREAIAAECRAVYGMNLQVDEITDCDGCRADSGRIFSGCLECQIRNCARVKEIENCAFCNEYACDKLLNHFDSDSGSRVRLEEVRKQKGYS